MFHQYNIHSNLKEMIDGVNYPRSSLYYYDYVKYLKAPIKLVIDRHIARGYILNQTILYEGDRIIDEVYLPYELDDDFVNERIFVSLEGKVVFNDMRNTGSDILGEHYLQYKVVNEDQVQQNEDGTYIIPEYDLDEDGKPNKRRFRIYPHPGHKKLSDLMKWGHCYKFDPEIQGWVYDENKRNHLIKYKKGTLKIKIADEVGDELERIADLSKLIFWLMYQHKDKLTPEQQDMVTQLLPDSDQLTKILKRDLFIFNFVQEYLSEDVPDHYEFEL